MEKAGKLPTPLRRTRSPPGGAEGLRRQLEPGALDFLPSGGATAELPTVDVFIPTYNEPLEVVETTVIAARQMTYPRDKLTVYILDDGGTQERLTAADPAKAREARERAAALKAVAAQWGAVYQARDANRDAKAGNLNNGLSRTDGDLVATLDADHVPVRTFLTEIVGHFRDPAVAQVQTAHHFYNPDLFQERLRIRAFIANNQDLNTIRILVLLLAACGMHDLAEVFLRFAADRRGRTQWIEEGVRRGQAVQPAQHRRTLPGGFVSAHPARKCRVFEVGPYLGPQGIAQALGVFLGPAETSAEKEFAATQRDLVGAQLVGG